MYGPISGDQQISAEQILMKLQCALQIRRARLFFAFQDELQIDGQGNILSSQSVEGGKQRHDRRFVVGSRARVDPPVIVIDGAMLRTVFWEGDALSAGFDGRVAKYRLERFPIRPRCRI